MLHQQQVAHFASMHRHLSRHVSLLHLSAATSFLGLPGCRGSGAENSFVKTSGGFPSSSSFGPLGFGMYDTVHSIPIAVSLPDPTRAFSFERLLWTKLSMTELTHASAINTLIAFIESSTAILLLKLIYVDLALI